MSYDLKRVIVKPFKKYQFELVENYDFELPCISGSIPKGFKTDGASIPRIFWSIYPPYKSEYFSACVIHDYLCGKEISKTFKDLRLANKALKEGMIALKSPRYQALLFCFFCNFYLAGRHLMRVLKAKITKNNPYELTF